MPRNSSPESKAKAEPKARPKKAKPPSKAKTPKPAAIHAAERFKMVEIDRSAMAFDPGNPRTITDQARKRLRAAIEETGIISPVTWNVRSGRIVGGHQRVRILDSLNGGKDYKLTVAQVDMSDAEEQAANVLLNNSESSGDWDLEALSKVLKTPGFNAVAAGMGSADIYKIIGAESSPDVLADCAARIEQARAIATATHEAAAERNSPHFYCVLVFKDYKERLAWTTRAGLDDNRYQSATDLPEFLPRADNPAETP